MERLKPEEQYSQLADFEGIVAPLERRTGQRLTGAARGWCIRAFEENADGFRACAERALKRGASPLGLLAKMAKDGDHRLPTIEPPRGRGQCIVCESEVDDAIYVAGQWWCPAHAEVAA